MAALNLRKKLINTWRT